MKSSVRDYRVWLHLTTRRRAFHAALSLVSMTVNVWIYIQICQKLFSGCFVQWGTRKTFTCSVFLVKYFNMSWIVKTFRADIRGSRKINSEACLWLNTYKTVLTNSVIISNLVKGFPGPKRAPPGWNDRAVFWSSASDWSAFQRRWRRQERISRRGGFWAG